MLFATAACLLLALRCPPASGNSQEQKQTFATMPSHQTAVAGSTVVLPCRVLNFHGLVQWTKDGFGLGTTRDLEGFSRYSMIGSDEENDFSLRIVQATLDDDADYQCQVSSPTDKPIRSDVAHLTIYVTPTYPKIDYMPIATAGVPYTLSCLTDGARPAPEMQWVDEKGSVITKGTQYHRRVRPDGKLIDTNFTYTFTPTRHHNGRTLTCQVFSPALNTALTTEAVIRVKYPPHVQLVFSPAKLKEGEEAFVTCKVDANPNNVTYRWFREGKEVPGAAGATLPLGVLSRSNQSATIACEVTNALGTARKTDQLNILYPPMFLAEPSSVSGEIGNMVTMKCRVDANPTAEIYWSRLRDNELVGTGEELTIEASKATAGVYVCSARSDNFPALDAQLHLRLRGPPRIKTTSVLVVREGQNAVLRCSVVSVPHPVSLTWEKEGVSLSPDGDWEVKEDQRADGVVSTLTIYNVSQDDFASYNCTVINEYGVGTQQIILQRPPLIPFMVIVGGGGGVVLVVILVIFFILCGCRPKERKEKADAAEKGAFANGISGKHHETPDVNGGSIELGQTEKVLPNLIPADARSTGKDDDYMPYVDYTRDYLRVPVSPTESSAHFQIGGPYSCYTPASDQPSSLPSSESLPPYTLQPQPTSDFNGDYTNGRHHPPANNDAVMVNGRLKHALLQDLKKELKGGVPHDLNTGALQSKYIIPPQTKIKPGTLV
ncbi:irregular chiasm C-roughest protein-like isoform X2 [Penaeus indicus]|uniref:irregular chiasm C-roughest protein-like isoform X2 n=1 Tax=Penaeus indicus TaxID=29960 RepID=UPI00300D121E